MQFTKLQALGNDFLVIHPDERATSLPWPEVTRKICHRHTGVGADGLILLERLIGHPQATWNFRIFNSDGSEAELSGNGLRAALACLHQRGLIESNQAVFLTRAGERKCELVNISSKFYSVLLHLPPPVFSSAKIPFDDGVAHEKIIDYCLDIGNDHLLINCVSVGNPHCCLFFNQLPAAGELNKLGATLESHPFFPQKTNVEFIRIIDRRNIEVRFWERGAGETQSSGTGASSAAVISIIKGLTESRLNVHTTLGKMQVEWQPGSNIKQTGPVEPVFEGKYLQ